MNTPAENCPICKNPTHKAFKPFCSKRCADVDLHRWMVGGYAIKGADGEALLPANDAGQPLGESED